MTSPREPMPEAELREQLPMPEMIAAAWAVVRDRYPIGQVMGPGPGFAEAIKAALDKALPTLSAREASAREKARREAAEVARAYADENAGHSNTAVQFNTAVFIAERILSLSAIHAAGASQNMSDELEAALEDATNWSHTATQEHEQTERIKRSACSALINLIRASWNIDAVRNAPAMEEARAFVQTYGIATSAPHCEICRDPSACVVCELSGEPRPSAIPAAGDSGEGWRAIRTAPKDGSDLWLFSAEDEPQQFVGHWLPNEIDDADVRGWWVYSDTLLDEAPPEGASPTHWMPLPPAPGAST